MDYVKIHDAIIERAKSRTIEPNIYYENHHIIPKCEGGMLNGETVKLTFKEHKLVHKLRYKFNQIIGNLYAVILMGSHASVSDRNLLAKHAAKFIMIIIMSSILNLKE